MANAIKTVNRIVRSVIVALFCTVTLVLAVSIVTRFLQPYMPGGIRIQIPWAEEFIKYAVLWICWLGAALVIPEHGHFALNLLTRKFPNLRIVRLVSSAVILFVAALFIFYGAQVCWSMRIQLTPSLHIPKLYINLIVPAAGALMVFYVIADLRSRRGGPAS